MSPGRFLFSLLENVDSTALFRVASSPAGIIVRANRVVNEGGAPISVKKGNVGGGRKEGGTGVYHTFDSLKNHVGVMVRLGAPENCF